MRDLHVHGGLSPRPRLVSDIDIECVTEGGRELGEQERIAPVDTFYLAPEGKLGYAVCSFQENVSLEPCLGFL